MVTSPPEDAPTKPVHVASAWFHRGHVNFDKEACLRFLDDGRGTEIKLYAFLPVPQSFLTTDTKGA